MGLFSSKSSSNSTTNIDERTTNTVDNRVGGDDSIFGGNQTITTGDNSGPINVTSTDFGAISGALRLAENSTSEAFGFGAESLRLTAETNRDAMTFADNALIRSSDLIGETLSEGADNLRFQGQQLQQAFDRSLDFAKVANTSENAQFLKQGVDLLKTGGVAILFAMAGFYYLVKVKK